VELLAAAAVLLGGLILAIRVVAGRAARGVPLAVGLGAATVFVLARNHYDLEDSRFVWVFLAVAGGAFLITVVVALLVRQGARRAVRYGAVAVLLQPAFFIAYIVALLTYCAFFSDCGLD
jgi:hypothetical protein